MNNILWKIQVSKHRASTFIRLFLIVTWNGWMFEKDVNNNKKDAGGEIKRGQSHYLPSNTGMHCNTLVLSISNLPYPVWKLEGKVPHFFLFPDKGGGKCPFSNDRGQLISAIATILLPKYNNLRMGRESGMSRLRLCWNCQMMAWRRILNAFNQFRSLFLVAYLTFRKKSIQLYNWYSGNNNSSEVIKVHQISY